MANSLLDHYNPHLPCIVHKATYLPPLPNLGVHQLMASRSTGLSQGRWVASDVLELALIAIKAGTGGSIVATDVTPLLPSVHGWWLFRCPREALIRN